MIRDLAALRELRFTVDGGTFNTTSTPSISSGTLDTTGKRVGWVYEIPEAATITHLGFRQTSRTGTPPTYRISLQGFDPATGFPDGTIKGGGAPASATFTPPADTSWDLTWQWIALANAYTVARGDQCATVVEWVSGTCDVSNKINLAINVTSGVSGNFPPYPLTHNGTTWLRVTQAGLFWGYQSATRSYGYPYLSFYTTAIAVDGHRLALKFRLPDGFCSDYTILGVEMTNQPPSSADWIVAIWDAAGAALQTVTVDSDFKSGAGLGQRHQVYFTDLALPRLRPGVWYYCGIQRTTVSTQLIGVNVASSADMSALPGGSEFILATWNGSTWTDVPTTRPYITPIFGTIQQGPARSARSALYHNRLGRQVPLVR